MVELSTGGEGTGQSFPKTRWSVIRDATDPSSATYRQSLEHLATTYWRPIYAHFRGKWRKSNDEAKDLTQDFFAALCEKDFLSHLSPEHGRFRSYVMAALDNFVRLKYRSQSRLKRGGGAAHFPLELGEGFDPPSSESPEQIFLREWARSVLGESLLELQAAYRQEGQEKLFQLFVAKDVNPSEGAEGSYEALARRFGMSVTDVTNGLYRARKKLRELVLKRVRDTVMSERDAESEMRDLFGEQDSA